MRHFQAQRLILLLVTLLTLGAYGEHAFGRYSACGCPCIPPATTSVPDSDQDGSLEAGTTHLVAGEDHQVADGDHEEGGNGCSCPCHVATPAVPGVGALTLSPGPHGVATLHAGPAQRPSEGVRVGIEYPPRVA